jgi:hypothetical protein
LEVANAVAGGGGDVSNAYLTSTFVTNTDFQSALANTNAQFISYWPSANVIAYTNKYLEVANSSSGASVSVQNTAPSSPSEGDLWWNNFNGDLFVYYSNNWVEATAQDVSPYTNNAIYYSGNTTIRFVRTDDTIFDLALSGLGGNLDPYWPSANIISYTNKYLEVANSSGGGASVSVQNTAPSSPSEGDLWWNNFNGDLFVYYSNNWVEATAQDVSPYTNNAIYYSGNTTIRFVRTDDTIFDLALSGLGGNLDPYWPSANIISYTNKYLEVANVVAGGGGDVSNAYLTSTFVTNTDFQSALANTNAQFVSYWPSANVIAYTAKYLEVANSGGGGDVSNAYLTSTYVTNSDFQSALANTNAQFVSYWPSANIISYTNKYLEVANSSSGASVSVQNTAPTGSSEGDLWWNNFNGDLFVYYSNNWVEATAQDVSPYTNNAIYYSGNTTIRFVRTDDTIFDLALSGLGGNLDPYWPSANVIAYTAKYLEVANSAGDGGGGGGDVSANSDIKFNSIGVGTDPANTTGDIRATGDITSNYSDSRLKIIEGKIDNPLEKLSQINGYYYRENEIAKSLGYNDNRRKIGVIAQEIEKVLPEIVVEAPISSHYKAVHYDKLVVLLIEAVKEQQIQIEELKSKLEDI